MKYIYICLFLLIVWFLKYITSCIFEQNKEQFNSVITKDDIIKEESIEKIGIVVARYKEDVKWLNEFDSPEYKIYLYNKGNLLNKQDLPKNVIQISLPNTGRESHTYLYHIINNYHKLSTYTVFLQGNPFDHVCKRKNGNKSLKKIIDEHISLSTKDLFYFNYVNEHIDNYDILHLRKYIKDLELNIRKEILLYCTGAQYIVHKDKLLLNKEDKYIRLYNILKHDKLNSPPEYKDYSLLDMNGYVMERLWGYVLNGN